MAENNGIIDNSERTHKTNIKMKRRLSFHHAITNNTLENALNEYGEYAMPAIDPNQLRNVDQMSEQKQQTLNDNLVLSYLDSEEFDYNSILTNILLNKNRSKTETLSMFTKIIDQLDSKIKAENKKLNQELSDSILDTIVSQIMNLIKDNKDFSSEFERVEKKFQDLLTFVNNKKHSHQNKENTSTSRNASKRISSINSTGQRVTSMIGGMSPQTPRFISSSSSPDLWDGYNNGNRQISNGNMNARINSSTFLDDLDKDLMDSYDLYFQRKQFDKLYELVLENSNEKALVLMYEGVIKNKILNDLSGKNVFNNNVIDDLLLKKYLGQLKQLNSTLDLVQLFLANRKNNLYFSIIKDKKNDITTILLTLEYIYQVIKLHNQIFVSEKQNINLIKFVQEEITNELVRKDTGINENKKYEDIIKSFFEKYENEFKLNFFYLLDEFKNRNEVDENNGFVSNDYSFDITGENGSILTEEEDLL